MTQFDLRQWDGFEAAGGNVAQPAVVDQVVLDSRLVASDNALFVALPGGTKDGHLFVADAAHAGARYAIVSKDWTGASEKIMLLRVECPLTALQQIAGMYRRSRKAIVIGVTGSSGKTMLKDMLHAILGDSHRVAASPESFNSQIGVALSLLNIQQDDEIAIIEAGISEKGEMKRLASMIAPDHCIITNIGKHHLATLQDVQTIALEKGQLTAKVPEGNWVLIPDHPHITRRGHVWSDKDSNLPTMTVLDDTRIGVRRYQIQFPDGYCSIHDVSFGFTYMLDLVTMAVKAAWLLGAPSEIIANGLKRYVPESMRTEVWKASTGVTFINSTYGSDPQSVDIALNRLAETPKHGRKIMVFGGLRHKGHHYSMQLKRIAKAIQGSGVQLLYLYGDDDFKPLLDGLNDVTISHHRTAFDALEEIIKQAHPNDYVLIKGPYKLALDEVMTLCNDALCHNLCFINLVSVQHNLAALRQKLPTGTRRMVMVKALAYGTEDIRVSKFLATCGIDILGVSYVEEGVALKRNGVKQAIFCLNATPLEAHKAVKWDLELGVGDTAIIDALAREASMQNRIIKVHLHIDTGMSRLGCRPENALQLAKHIRSYPSLLLEGIMTHFACADNPAEDVFTHLQMQRFDQVIAQLAAHGIHPPWRHAANSSATIRFPQLPYNMVRVGLAAYGLHTSETTQSHIDLKLAISLNSRIAGLNHCKKGESISYGRTYRVHHDEQCIAVIPLGYFDGLHRTYSGKGCMMVRGEAAPMVGNICMDYSMLDVTHIPGVSVGDPVLVFGEDEYGQTLPPEALALSGGSIAHELISCLGPRIQRVFIYE